VRFATARRHPAAPSDASPATAKRVVLYLRVSSKRQVNTDYDPEGISLPAQRDACLRKAQQLGLEVVDEYVEPGQSGREMTKRVAFQQMLERIRNQRDIDHVMVYKLSRMNRNRIDDAFVLTELRQRNVSLISATENIDDTPIGQLMHGILATINEFRSAEDGADIRYKLGEKAKKGGTIYKAPIGYMNVGERVDDREVRTVKPDPKRSHFIPLAFELYATGDYTFQDLSDELFDRGLSTRATISTPAGQLTAKQVHRMLQDRYYLGLVRYDGEHYEGRHEPLVNHELFDTVQRIIQSRSAVDERRRVHHHYLKGTIYCGICEDSKREGGRMIQSRAEGRGGTYEYFFCTHRLRRICESRYVPAQLIEQAIADHYYKITFSKAFVDTMRAGLHQTMTERHESTISLRAQLETEIQALNTKETNLVELAADGTLPRETIRSRVDSIRIDRAAFSSASTQSGRTCQLHLHISTRRSHSSKTLAGSTAMPATTCAD
jgi:site-specific DNA recombinase